MRDGRHLALADGASRSAPSADMVFGRVAALLASFSPVMANAAAEAAMDYLADHHDFMDLLASRVGAALGRDSFGPEDVPFEELMVDLMTELQQRLESQMRPALAEAVAANAPSA